MEGRLPHPAGYDGKRILICLTEDQGELHNLWDEEEFIHVKEEMLRELASAMMRAEDPLPVPHFRYRTKVHPDGYWYQDYESADPGVRKMEPIGKRLG